MGKAESTLSSRGTAIPKLARCYQLRCKQEHKANSHVAAAKSKLIFVTYDQVVRSLAFFQHCQMEHYLISQDTNYKFVFTYQFDLKHEILLETNSQEIQY